MKKITIFIILILININFVFGDKIKEYKKIQSDIKKSIDSGLRFLRNSQNKDNHWGDPGITSLALMAFFKSPRKYGPSDGPWIRKPIKFLVDCQKENGGIYFNQLANYNTCIAVLALTSNKDVFDEHKHVVEKAKKFIIKLQCDEGEGYTPEEDIFYGGMGYGGDERPDISNTQFAIEALREAGLPADDPAIKKALVFLQRCQNRSESNDQEWASNDGGFIYYPANSPAGESSLPNGKKGFRSYGSMTYAGIKSYIYADLKKDDPRVKSAYKWIQENYDLSENPGMGPQGLFYYYHTFAKTFIVLGDFDIKDIEGNSRDWRKDLSEVLIYTQNEDGSWKNDNPRWWENLPVLATSYAVLSLCYAYESLENEINLLKKK